MVCVSPEDTQVFGTHFNRVDEENNEVKKRNRVSSRSVVFACGDNGAVHEQDMHGEYDEGRDSERTTAYEKAGVDDEG